MYRSFVSISSVSDREFVCGAPLLACVHRSYSSYKVQLVVQYARQKDVSRQGPQINSDSDATLWSCADLLHREALRMQQAIYEAMCMSSVR
jgi:hypothetical protein